MLLEAEGQGDYQWGSDVSASIAKWGTWNAAMTPLAETLQETPGSGLGRKMGWARSPMPRIPPPSALRKPSVVDALIGALGARSDRAVLIDVGAGQGLFSLAAAARGCRTVSFEASPSSVASFRAR